MRLKISAVLLALALSLPSAAPAQEGRISLSREARLVAAAIERTSHTVIYDGAYRGIAYPGGDVPGGIGVCTDVIIRAYRAGLGVDLQKMCMRTWRGISAPIRKTGSCAARTRISTTGACPTSRSSSRATAGSCR